MARPKKTTNSRGSSSKGKLNTIHTNTDTHATDNLDGDDLDLYNLDEISSDELVKLRGYGNSTNNSVTKFDPNKVKFHSFSNSLKHYLTINGYWGYVSDSDISRVNNLTLFLAISNCLAGEALDLAQDECF